MMQTVPAGKRLIWPLLTCMVLLVPGAMPVNGQTGLESRPIRLTYGWQYHLGDLPRDNQGIPGLTPANKINEGWKRITDIANPPGIPLDVTTVWYRIKLPNIEWANPALYFGEIYGQSLSIYLDNQKVFEKEKSLTRYFNKIIFPIGRDQKGRTLFIRIDSSQNTFGPRSNVFIGNYHDLTIKYLQNGFFDIALGCALALLALIMLFCCVFLTRELKMSWISLCLVILLLGIAVAVYPNKFSQYFPTTDDYSKTLTDIVKILFFPIFTYLFEQLFGPGYKLFIRRLRQVQIIFAGFCLGLMLFNIMLQYRINSVYLIFTSDITAIFCIVQFLILAGTAINYALKGNTDARIFTGGFFVFAIISCFDIFKYFLISSENPFSLWKWGLLVFVITLTVILGRRVAASYNQAISYARELEIKNRELDSMWQEIKKSRDQLAELNKTLEVRVQERTEQLVQSEKMAALGQLVAGITHEINTPLGAIRASIGNINETLSAIFEELPDFFSKLSRQGRDDFLVLLKKCILNDPEALSIREERSLRKSLISQLQAEQIPDYDELADMLVAIGIFDIRPLLGILKNPDYDALFKMVYTIAGLQRNVRTITIAAERTAKVVFALKTYTHHHHSGEKIKADIIHGIETVLTLYHNKIKHQVEVVRNYQPIPPIYCYPDELNQVWTNLIDNALQAMNYQGRLIITVSQAGDYVIVSITDNGPGITENIKERIFDPFFTTKPQGEGSGMGLDIVKRIVEKHKGMIKLNSIPGDTTFSVFIPLGQEQQA